MTLLWHLEQAPALPGLGFPICPAGSRDPVLTTGHACLVKRPSVLLAVLAGGGDQRLILREARPGWELAQLSLGFCRTGVGTGTLCSSHLCALGQEAVWQRVPATTHWSDPG